MHEEIRATTTGRRIPPTSALNYLINRRVFEARGRVLLTGLKYAAVEEVVQRARGDPRDDHRVARVPSELGFAGG